MRRFLKYELDRYLSGRGGERERSCRCTRVENQAYIHYAKGTLVMYALRDVIGEENLNRALATTSRTRRTSRRRTRRARAGRFPARGDVGRKVPLLDELLATIILYDNRVISASVTPHNGKYDVTIEYEAAKRESDGIGRETQVALDDWIEVGVFAREAVPVSAPRSRSISERKRITQSSGKFTMTVDAMPYEVGSDPFNKLIDRLPDDNRKTVETGATATAPSPRTRRRVRVKSTTGAALIRPRRCIRHRSGPRRDQSKPSALIIAERLLDLFARVHHERTIARDRLVQRLAGEQQDLRRACGVSRYAELHRVARVQQRRLTFGDLALIATDRRIAFEDIQQAALLAAPTAAAHRPLDGEMQHLNRPSRVDRGAARRATRRR